MFATRVKQRHAQMEKNKKTKTTLVNEDKDKNDLVTNPSRIL